MGKDKIQNEIVEGESSLSTEVVQEIENRVFQAIAVKGLSAIRGISFLEGTLFDDLLGREGLERVKGIVVEQDSKQQKVSLKVELNLAYGYSIPDKVKEIQEKLSKDVLAFTGLNLTSIHIIFRNIFFEDGFDASDSRAEDFAEAAEIL